ncbi:MAG: hypothetical protein JSU87_03180 [Gemmatimonadota bacterium]|nr:MAG: hypothetical protein JSU87_03180 [Gemmatimonadota bacterium]
MRTLTRLFVPLIALLAGAGSVLAQGMPTSQPSRLMIYVEELKVGMDRDHAANEAGWPAAFAKANSPYYYLAFASMTGPGQVWFVQPFESYAAEAQSMKLVADNPALSAELERLWRADAEYLESGYSIEAVARPDLSYGQFPDLGLVRFYDISTFRIRPGHEQGFEAAAKVYRENFERGMPGASYRIYQVMNGMPGVNYLVFGAVNDYAELDKMMADGNAMWGSMSEEDMAVIQKAMTDDVQFYVSNRFRVDAGMSYVSEETKAKDPAFWGAR